MSDDNKSASETKIVRKKVPLGKGYSLIDWYRLCNNTADLACTNGVLKEKISLEELSLHDKVEDCWMAIHGKVYNVTPYMKYHPGGIDELMRGAGKEATSLFNEIHEWVNLKSMLEKCLVGYLDKSDEDSVASTSN